MTDPGGHDADDVIGKDDWEPEPDENDSGECQECHGWWGYVVLPGGELGSRYTCDCGNEVRHVRGG